jgi:hypothetical protein
MDTESLRFEYGEKWDGLAFVDSLRPAARQEAIPL